MIELEHLREGGPSCPSDLALDRFVAGERTGSDAVSAHLEACAECRERVASRRRGFESFAEVDAAALGARVVSGAAEARSRSALRTVALAVVPLAAAFALVVGLRRGGAPAPVETSNTGALEDPSLASGTRETRETREKGGLALHVFREVGGRSDEVVSGARLAPGDRLRFVVDLPAAGQVRVLGVEASGSLYTAWPLDTGASTSRGAGRGQALPGAVALDASHGRETLYLVLCPGSVTPSCVPGTPDPACPATCQLTPFVMEKP